MLGEFCLFPFLFFFADLLKNFRQKKPQESEFINFPPLFPHRAYSDTRSGIMDTNLFDYESAFGITLNLTKAQRLSLDQSQMTHAMVITGAHVDETTGKIIRYRVENSWGTENVGDKGEYTRFPRPRLQTSCLTLSLFLSSLAPSLSP